MSQLTERQRILLQTTAVRDRAEALLRGLMDARERSEKHLAEVGLRDHVKQVTGKSSIDNAIESTRRYIDSLNRAIVDVRRELSDEDMAALSEERLTGIA
ncbi:MAG: hypothetical protein RBS39_02095 [Phycisphaerales bacterium]|nr:hypothetical protein [Phycisphaerales bacterium]